MQPKQEYGYVIIDTEEKRKAFEPKLEADEYFSDGKWVSIGGPCLFSFLPQFIYRRKISPGEGFEIVPEQAIPQTGMQFTCDGLKWHPFIDRFASGFEMKPIAWRQRKQSLPAPVEQSPWRAIGDLEGYKNTEWVILGRICKDYGNEFQWIKTESEIPSGYTHWQPIAPVPKPVKPMTEGEALRACVEAHHPDRWKDIERGWLAHIEFIKKGGGK